MMRIALINPNTDEAATHRMVEIARAAAPAGVAFIGMTAARGAPLITNGAQLADARAAVLAMIPDLRTAVDGVIVAAFADPGLPELRAAVPAPVVGIGETSLLEAARAGRRFCVVTTTLDLAPAIARAVAVLDLSQQFGGVILTQGDAIAVTGSPDLLLSALEDAIERAVIERGVSAVVIGGGPLAAAARILADRMPVTVVEPVPLAARRVVALGLEWSRRKAVRAC